MSSPIELQRNLDGPSNTPHGRPTTVIAAALLLVVAVALVFSQAARHQFVNFDDDRYVYDNPHVTGGLNPGSIAWVFYGRHSHNWHPLTGLSHLIDWQVYRDYAGGHHITSVFWHAVTVVLLMLVLRRMTGRLWPSVFTAALFAIHPLRVESVAWVAERKDVLSGMFFMLTLYAYERYVRSGLKPAYFLLVMVCYICGLMAKPMLVTVPFVLLLLDFWPLRRVDGGWWTAQGGRWSVVGGREEEGRRQEVEYRTGETSDRLLPESSNLDVSPIAASLNPPPSTHHPSPFSDHRPPTTDYRSSATILLEKIPLFILSLASCALTIFVQSDAMQSVDRVTLGSRAGNAMIAYAEYLGEFFYPHRLAVLYPHPTSEIDITLAKICGIGVLIVTIVAFLLARRWPVLIVGWFWYLVMLVPVIGIVQVGGAAMADRYTYLPQIGIAMALVWTADAVVTWILTRSASEASRYGPRSRVGQVPSAAIQALMASCIIALLIVCAWRQTTFWRDSESLWTRDLSMFGARNAVGNYNLGMTVAETGRNEEAIALYRRALAASPDDSDTYINLGLAQANSGHTDDAIASYNQAIKLDSTDWQAHKNLGVVFHDQRKMAETVRVWRIAIDRRFAQRKEEMPDILWSSAWILATTPDDKLRNPAEAVKLAERAAKASSYLDPVVLDAMAAAYAAAGRFEEAIAWDQKAVVQIEGKIRNNDILIPEIRTRLATHSMQRNAAAVAKDEKDLQEYLGYNKNNKLLIKDYRKRIALYEKGKPYRDAK